MIEQNPPPNCAIAWDPGVTTGICIIELLPDDFRVHQSATMPWERRFTMVPDILKWLQPKYIVIERFALYASKAKDQIGSEFPSAQLRGVIEMASVFVLNTTPHVIIQPASIMTRVEILERDAPLILPSEHARDAYKHARYFATEGIRHIHKRQRLAV